VNLFLQGFTKVLVEFALNANALHIIGNGVGSFTSNIEIIH